MACLFDFDLNDICAATTSAMPRIGPSTAPTVQALLPGLMSYGTGSSSVVGFMLATVGSELSRLGGDVRVTEQFVIVVIAKARYTCPRTIMTGSYK